MATLDRIDPAYVSWSPSASGIAIDDEYTGRHRRPTGLRRLSLVAMFRTARHRR